MPHIFVAILLLLVRLGVTEAGGSQRAIFDSEQVVAVVVN
jgi:hypothetical protein